MQIIEVERVERGQLRRIRVDSHSSILLKVADEIQVGLTTLRVQKIGQPLPEPRLQQAASEPDSPSPPATPSYPASPPKAPGRPTSLRSRGGGFDAPAPPTRPESPARAESEPVGSEREREIPIWAQGTLGPGSGQQQGESPAPSRETAPPPPPSRPPVRSKDDGDVLEWGNRPNVDFLLEYLAGPLRGCQVSLTPAEMAESAGSTPALPETAITRSPLKGRTSRTRRSISSWKTDASRSAMNRYRDNW